MIPSLLLVLQAAVQTFNVDSVRGPTKRLEFVHNGVFGAATHFNEHPSTRIYPNPEPPGRGFRSRGPFRGEVGAIP